jgi:hypothetical protein
MIDSRWNRRVCSIRGKVPLINFGNHCCEEKPTQAIHIFLMFQQPECMTSGTGDYPRRGEIHATHTAPSGNQAGAGRSR